MASRPGEDGVLSLSPAALRVAGWVAVIALIAAIALTVRFLGGNADGTAVEDGKVDHGQLFHTYLEAVGVDSTQHFDIAGQQIPIADPAVSSVPELLT